jgi:DNA-directed RNA polymerase alpha subunit
MPNKNPSSDFPNIGSPARRALEHEGYTTLKQLTKLSEAKLLQMHGVGPKAVRILKETLKEKGLSFKPAKARKI